MAKDLDKELGFEPVSDDEIGFEPEVQEQPVPEKSLLSKAKDIGQTGLDYGLTALDYTYAPVRQALTSPAKLVQGDISGAILDPITQLAKGPSEAPTSAQVLEAYGVPKEKEVSPIIQSQPLMGSTYEQNPLPEDPENITINPSQQGAPLLDTMVGGIGLSTATKGITGTVGTAKELINESQTLEDLINSYKAGKKGVNLSAPEFLQQSRDEIKELARSSDDAIRQKSSEIFSGKKAKLAELEKAGLKSDVGQELKDFADEIGSSTALRDEETKILNNVLTNNFTKSSVKTPQELENLLRDLKDLKANVQTPSGMDAVNRVINKVKAKQDLMDPSLLDFNKKAFNVVEAGEALTKKNPLDYLTGKTDLTNTESIANMLERSASDYKTKSFLDDILNKGLETSKNVKISPLSETVPQVNENIKKAQDIAKNMDLAQKIQSPTFQGSNIFDSTLNALTSGGSKVANKIGKLKAKPISDEILTTKGVKAISEANPENLAQISSKMKTKGTIGQNFANIIEGMKDKTPQSKNAIIFSLMQQPEFRKMFHEVNGDE